MLYLAVLRNRIRHANVVIRAKGFGRNVSDSIRMAFHIRHNDPWILDAVFILHSVGDDRIRCFGCGIEHRHIQNGCGKFSPFRTIYGQVQDKDPIARGPARNPIAINIAYIGFREVFDVCFVNNDDESRLSPFRHDEV